MRITKSVRKLEAYTPGEQPKSRNVVKLNTNENPYPPSPKCAAVLRDFDLDRLRKYPDPNFAELRKALAKLNRTCPENIFVGNGSDEILALSAKAFVEDDEAIGSLDPSYSLYKTLAAIRNVEWQGLVPVPNAPPPAPSTQCPAPSPKPQAPSTKHQAPSTKISLFLWTNPNAPTGEFAEPSVVAAFARKFPGVVMVDEAYADFARTNCMPLATCPENRNVIVMRTFSKSYSLAGLRVGYCVGPRDLIDALYKVKDSYNVDAIAQSVALAAVRDQAWMRRNVRKVIRTRAYLKAELERRGWDIIPSESNFLFARPAEVPAALLFDALRRRKIFVRYFSGPKTRDRLRITIGTDDQIATLLKAIDLLTPRLLSPRTPHQAPRTKH